MLKPFFVGTAMRRSGVRVLKLSAILGLLAGTAVLANSSSRAEAGQSLRPNQPVERPEVLIGTAGAPLTEEPKAATPGWDRDPSVADNPAPVTAAANFYTQALRALDAGDVTAAQSLFEKAIAADPQSPRAADARRHLGQIYTAVPGTGVVPSAAAGAPSPNDADDGPNEVTREDAQAERQGLAAGSDDEQFLIEAGDRVFFSSSSSELGGRARSVLAAQAAWLTKRPDYNVTIEGHADDPPLNEQELEDLSEARGQAVRDRLVVEGVAAKRISVVPWGRNAPISDCSETGCQAQNRRAVTVLTPRQGPGKEELSEQSGRKRPAGGSPLTASRSDPAAR